MSKKGVKQDNNLGEDLDKSENDSQPIDEKNTAQDENNITEEASLESQLAETKDQLLRALAEVENTRKRAKREKEDTAQYAITKFARDMLTVNDNLERAIKSVKNKDHEEIKSLLEGIEITQKEINSIFTRYAISQVKSVGEKFDPNFHQAMFEVEDQDKEAGIVIEEVQTGYKIADRLLRPAMVGVVKN